MASVVPEPCHARFEMTPGGIDDTFRGFEAVPSMNCSSLVAPRSATTAIDGPDGRGAKRSRWRRPLAVSGRHFPVARSPRQTRVTSESRSLSA